MSISLVKGQKIDLTKGNAGLNKVVFGLGWDTNRYDGNADFDLDVSAFFTDDSGKVTGEQDFVFYGQSQHPSGALIYSGDNRTGVGDGDDETMIVELNKIPSNITKISFSATIYDAENRLQNFGMVGNAYVRVVDEETGEELIRFDLSEDFSTETALVVAEIYKHNGEWKFKAVGSGYNGGLKALCNQYGIDAE